MPSRPLSADRTLEVRLHTRAGTLASAVARGVTTRGQAVAALSLIAPCRPELTERVLERVGSVPAAEVEWPPRAVQIALLGSSHRVTEGSARLAGPEGVTVEHVTYVDKLGHTRRVLRLERHGVTVGDFRTVEELGRHVDVAALHEEAGGPVDVSAVHQEADGPVGVAAPHEEADGHVDVGDIRTVEELGRRVDVAAPHQEAGGPGQYS